MAEIHATDALVVPPDLVVDGSALRKGVVTEHELDAMRRHVKLAGDLRGCRYFTEEERNWSVTMDKGVPTSWEQTLPDAGTTRDMVTILRQLFGDAERASFASMAALLRRLADPAAPSGKALLNLVGAFEIAKNGVLDSWDAQSGGVETSPQPPLTVFLDWLYGEFLHSDAEKAKRIEQLDGGEFRLYEWQFHWVVERLATVFTNFACVVRSALGVLQAPS